MTQPQPTPAAGGKGPIGEARNPTTVALLSLVTCGIYGLYWAYLTFEELKQHNGEGLGGGLGALLSWLVAGWFLVIVEIQKMYQADGRESPVEPIEGLWLLIPIAGWFLYMNRVQGALNDYWVSKGAAPLPS
ncbi:MAG TPA: DUF4234 domain-containing protein [Acidimicrobiia bacterium]|nr:DUF4234 domain-containing protein [Acidimicrobiia bacterium]